MQSHIFKVFKEIKVKEELDKDVVVSNFRQPPKLLSVFPTKVLEEENLEQTISLIKNISIVANFATVQYEVNIKVTRKIDYDNFSNEFLISRLA